MDTAAEIHVTDTAVTAVLVGGDWVNLSGVVVSFADFTRGGPGGPTRTGYGLWVAGTIQGGPHNGGRFVAPLDRVDALRVTP